MKNHSFILIALLFPFICYANPGIDDFNQKRYDSAFRRLLPDAESGQAAALFYLGRIYLDGLGSAPKDSSRGVSLITKSAEKNYEPAIKYLAQSAERSGNLKQALIYLEKLKSNGDITIVEKIADINEQLYNKERELTVSYCNSLESAKIINKTYNEIRYVNCILENKFKDKNIQEGVQLLRSLADKGIDAAVLQLIPYLISNKNDKSWDPVYADTFIFKNMGNPKVMEQLKPVIAKADLTFEICRFTPPGSSFQTQNYRASLCRLSALKGDQKAALFVAERHLSGFDSFLQDVKKAEFFIDLLDAGVIKNELKLYSLQLANKSAEHFDFLIKNLEIDPGKLNEGFDFFIRIIFSDAKREQILAPSLFIQRSALINKHADCKVRTDLFKYYEDYYVKNLLKLSFESSELADLDASKPDTNCAGLNIARPKRVGISPPQAASTLSNSPSSTPRTIGSQPQQSTSGSISEKTILPMQSFKSLSETCDIKDAKSCLAAADLLINKQALNEISDESVRRKIIFEFLNKSDPLEATIRKFDLLSSFSFFQLAAEERILLSAATKDLEKYSSDSALIRLFHSSINTFNPVGSLFDGLTGKVKQKCASLASFKNKKDITFIEKKYIDDSLNSIHCKNAS